MSKARGSDPTQYAIVSLTKTGGLEAARAMLSTLGVKPKQTHEIIPEELLTERTRMPRRRYSDEELEWIRQNVGKLTWGEALRGFNEKFTDMRSKGGFKNKCVRMGIRAKSANAAATPTSETTG